MSSKFDEAFRDIRDQVHHDYKSTIGNRWTYCEIWNAALEELEDSIPDMGPDSIDTELSNVYKNISDLYE